jgi:hypothetical protein
VKFLKSTVGELTPRPVADNSTAAAKVTARPVTAYR